MSYELKGRILEACDCNVLCPCWIGENPDNGTCDAVLAYQIDQGAINGVGMSGRTVAYAAHIPGNIFAGNFKSVVFIDDGSSQEQHDLLAQAFTGKLGGPLADLAQLTGEYLAVESTPILFTIEGAKGNLTIGSTTDPILDTELAPYTDRNGNTTQLVDSVFSTIPGSPAWVGKATHFKRKTAQYGIKDLSLNGRNAVQGNFHFKA